MTNGRAGYHTKHDKTVLFDVIYSHMTFIAVSISFHNLWSPVNTLWWLDKLQNPGTWLYRWKGHRYRNELLLKRFENAEPFM